MSELSEINALPAAARSKLDHQVHDGKLSLSVASDRPSTVEIPPVGAIVETDPETESKEPTVKQAPFRPQLPPLLILDLNGCILYREYVSGSGHIIKPRPYLEELFQYLLTPHPKDDDSNDDIPNWEIMIWSSAMDRNVRLMCDAIKISKRPPVRRVEALRERTALNNQLNDISNLLESTAIDTTSPPKKQTVKPVDRTVIDVWDRSKLDIPAKDYDQKVSTTKDLRKVWDQVSWTNPRTGKKLKWGSQNTVIVDDSPDKLTFQPDNLFLIEEYKGDPNDQSVLELIENLKSLRNEPNITEAMKQLKEKKTSNAT